MNKETYSVSKEEIKAAAAAIQYEITESQDITRGAEELVDSFLNESSQKLSGESWSAIKSNLKTYDSLLEYSQELSQIIHDADTEYLQTLYDFLGTDDSLNSDDLPILISEKEAIETEIARLEAENAELALVPEIIMECVGYDPDGNPVYDWVHNPAYDAAQAQIAENNNRIATELIPDLNEHNRLIDKINELVNVLLPGLNKKLEEVEKQVHAYLNKMSEMLESGKGRAFAKELAYRSPTGDKMYYSFAQDDERWQGSGWQSKHNQDIAKGGCAVCALASSLATIFQDPEITPYTVGQVWATNHSEYINESMDWVGPVCEDKEYGLAVDPKFGSEVMKDSEGSIRSVIQNGGAVIAAANNGTHFIAIIGYNEATGNFIVADSDPGKGNPTIREVDGHTARAGVSMYAAIAPPGMTIEEVETPPLKQIDDVANL